jgi:hypothetical protein
MGGQISGVSGTQCAFGFFDKGLIESWQIEA